MSAIYQIDTRSPNFQFLRATLPRMALLVCLPFVIAFIAGELSLSDVLLVLGFVVALLLMSMWAFARQERGKIEIADDGIHVRTASHGFFPWPDVRRLSSVSYGDTQARSSPLLRLLGIDTDFRCVRVELSRWTYRHPLWGKRWGPAEAGLPEFRKTVVLFPENPDGFVREASALVERAEADPLAHEPVT